MSQYDHTFDSIYINLTEVGETAGVLDQTLWRVATYLEKKEALRRKIRQALAYPVFVISVAVVATIFLLTSIVPTFAEMFADFGAELPAPTRLVLSISDAVSGHMVGMSFTIAAIFGVGRYIYRHPRYGLLWDRQTLKVPFIGLMIRKSLIARFCRTLSTLLSSGVALDQSLEIISRATGNRFVDKALSSVNQSNRRGAMFHSALKQTALFPDMVIQLILAGEQTATMDEMLSHAATHYEEEVDVLIEGLGSLLEPVLIVLIGVVVGGLLVALYLPMFDLANVVG